LIAAPLSGYHSLKTIAFYRYERLDAVAVRSGASSFQIGMPGRPLTAVRPIREWIEHRP
jgi:hypothetical protein